MAFSIASVSLATGIPFAFGVLTTYTLEQAVIGPGPKRVIRAADAD